MYLNSQKTASVPHKQAPHTIPVLKFGAAKSTVTSVTSGLSAA